MKQNEARAIHASGGATLQERPSIGSAAELDVRGREAIADLAAAIAAIVNATADDENHLCACVGKVLADALKDVSWIAESLREPARKTYRRERLYEAPDAAFSLGCFVWAPGQQTPIHDHSGWSVVGCAQGALESVPFHRTPTDALRAGPPEIVRSGSCVWSRAGQDDIHRLGAFGLGTAVSVHVYGSAFANASRRKYLMDGTVLSQ